MKTFKLKKLLLFFTVICFLFMVTPSFAQTTSFKVPVPDFKITNIWFEKENKPYKNIVGVEICETTGAKYSYPLLIKISRDKKNFSQAELKKEQEERENKTDKEIEEEENHVEEKEVVFDSTFLRSTDKVNSKGYLCKNFYLEDSKLFNKKGWYNIDAIVEIDEELREEYTKEYLESINSFETDTEILDFMDNKNYEFKQYLSREKEDDPSTVYNTEEIRWKYYGQIIMWDRKKEETAWSLNKDGTFWDWNEESTINNDHSVFIEIDPEPYNIRDFMLGYLPTKWDHVKYRSKTTEGDILTLQVPILVTGDTFEGDVQGLLFINGKRQPITISIDKEDTPENLKDKENKREKEKLILVTGDSDVTLRSKDDADVTLPENVQIKYFDIEMWNYVQHSSGQIKRKAAPSLAPGREIPFEIQLNPYKNHNEFYFKNNTVKYKVQLPENIANPFNKVYEHEVIDGYLENSSETNKTKEIFGLKEINEQVDAVFTVKRNKSIYPYPLEATLKIYKDNVFMGSKIIKIDPFDYNEHSEAEVRVPLWIKAIKEVEGANETIEKDFYMNGVYKNQNKTRPNGNFQFRLEIDKKGNTRELKTYNNFYSFAQTFPQSKESTDKIEEINIETKPLVTKENVKKEIKNKEIPHSIITPSYQFTGGKKARYLSFLDENEWFIARFEIQETGNIKKKKRNAFIQRIPKDLDISKISLPEGNKCRKKENKKFTLIRCRNLEGGDVIVYEGNTKKLQTNKVNSIKTLFRYTSEGKRQVYKKLFKYTVE